MRRKRRSDHSIWIVGSLILAIILLIIIIVAFVRHIQARKTGSMHSEEQILNEKYIEEWPDIDVQLLDVNEYSRPQIALDKVNGIVIHYTANPGSTAQQNRDYFNGLAQSGETYASSHFVIGLEGEIIQCIPCDEMAYASNDRNEDTIAIECCIPDETGKFNGETYDSLVELTAWLIGRYHLGIDDVIRHYDVTGKICPKYFVDHEDAWKRFKADVVAYIDENGAERK